MIPDTIDRYKLTSIIGKGGMSIVYAAWDEAMKREVAIKVLPRELLQDATFIERFKREASSLASLEHPAIIPIYAYGESDDQPFLVMKLLKGGSLAQRLKSGPLPLAEAARILSHFAPALDKAHQQGIIHRDLKPGNILFDEYDKPYISDFGLAKLAEASATLTGNAIVGTPAYMSPEQGRGEKDLDGRSDVYSLGIISFEILTGHIPYEAATDVDLIAQHIRAPIPNILDYRVNLPPDFQVLINRSLSKRREGRFSTAGEMAKALQAVVEGKPIPPPLPVPDWIAGMRESEGKTISVSRPESRKTIARTSKLESGLQTIAARQTQTRSGKPPKNNKWSWIGAIFLLLALLGLASIGLVTYTQNSWNLATVQAFLHLSAPTQTVTLSIQATATPPNQASNTPNPQPSHTPSRVTAPSLTPNPTATQPPIIESTEAALFPANSFIGLPEPVGTLTVDTIQSSQKAVILGQGVFTGLVYNPDGSVMAVFGTTGIDLYKSGTFQHLDWLPSRNPVMKAEFSPDGRLLAAAEQDSVVVWDWQNRQRIHTMITDPVDYIDHLAFSAGGNILISGSENTYLWDIQSGILLRSFPEIPARSVAVSPDDENVAVPFERVVQLIRISDGTYVDEFKFYNAIRTAFISDGAILVAAASEIINLIKIETREIFGFIGGRNLVISQDGNNLVVDNTRGLVQVWRLNAFSMPQGPYRWYPFENNNYEVSFQISGDGGVLAIWNVHELTHNHFFSPDFINTYDVIEGISLGVDNLTPPTIRLDNMGLPPLFEVVFSPLDGKAIATLRDYSALEAWDVTSEGPTHAQYLWQPGDLEIPFNLSSYSFPDKVIQLQSPDQKLTAAVVGLDVRINRSDGSELLTLSANLVDEPDIAFSPSSELLATLSTGGTVRIWRINTKQQVCVAGGVGTVAKIDDVAKLFFSDDSRYLVIYHTDEDISYWDATSCKLLVRYPLNSKLYSPDGSLFVEFTTAQIKVRSVSDGSIQRVLYGNFQEPAGFDSLGKYFAATARDGTIHIWAVMP
jgi:serine/threonine protein kinase/WD40 repeat protein